MERRSQIFGEASLENILEEIYGTPFTDLRRSLLRKYSRRGIWNAVHRSWMEPLVKYSRRDIWNAVHRLSTKPLEKIVWNDIWNAVHRCPIKPLEKIF